MRWVALAGLVLLGGCAANPDDCDPSQVGNVVTALSCDAGGGYTARRERIQTQTSERIENARLTTAETDRLRTRARALAADEQAWRSERARLDRDLSRLQLQVTAARASNAEDQERLQALRAQTRELQRELASAPAAEDGASEAEIAELTTEVERKRQAIEALLEEVVE
jgi:chromosome segregation ATPase